MRILRGLLGALLWILAALLGLVGFVLCVTVILLPLGIPLLVVARRLLTRAVQLMLPRSLAHPIDEATKTAKKQGRKAKSVASGTAGDISKAAGDIGKKASKAANKQRKRVA
jgi:hypothetical protein